ncbi:MAG: DUF2752 domain-containing protein [Bacteroidetes bacterium]|nr:DUF2752 domain-containing protein [Bacteroidota bacterium]
MKFNLTQVSVISVFFGAAVILFFFDPLQFGLYPKCIFYSLTGFKCPGCGGLRAINLFLHGNTLESINQNILVVGALPFLFTEIFFPNNKFKLATYFTSSVGIIILSVFIFLFTLLRNIF